jgi:hypothetical protein
MPSRLLCSDSASRKNSTFTSLMSAPKNASMMLTAIVDTVLPCAKKPEQKSGGWKWFTKEEIENVEEIPEHIRFYEVRVRDKLNLYPHGKQNHPL